MPEGYFSNFWQNFTATYRTGERNRAQSIGTSRFPQIDYALKIRTDESKKRCCDV